MKAKEVRELSEKELIEKIAAEAVALNQMKISHSVSPVDSPANIKKQRRTIARLKTILRERELKQQ